MPFKCLECNQEKKIVSLFICYHNKKQNFQKLKKLLVCKDCVTSHKTCNRHYEAAKTMGEAFERKVDQIAGDELPKISAELFEFGKKLNDKAQFIHARSKEMWDEIYGQTENIEDAMNRLERAFVLDEEIELGNELFKKIEENLKQEITSDQKVNRTMSASPLEDLNGGSVELMPNGYINPPPPYEEAGGIVVNRPSLEPTNPLRPILRNNGYSVPLEENGDRRSRPVTSNLSRSRRRSSVQFRDLSPYSIRSGFYHVDNEVAEKRVQGIYTGPQFIFENQNRNLGHVRVSFSNDVKQNGIPDDGLVSFTLTNYSSSTMCIFIIFFSPNGTSFYAPTMEINEDRRFYRQAFEISSNTSSIVDLDFNKALSILNDWASKKDSRCFPFLRMRALGEIKNDGKYDWQEWTIRFTLRRNRWIPIFDRLPPKEHIDYRK